MGESRDKTSRLLRCCLSAWRRADVDDVEGLSDGEILVTDEVCGRESRGGGRAFEKTKGGSNIGWRDTARSGAVPGRVKLGEMLKISEIFGQRDDRGLFL